MNTHASSIPPGTTYSVGVGLKSEHYVQILKDKPPLGFFEIHAENFMSPGGAHHRYLEEITASYPLSIHGVGMSLGSAEGLDVEHLKRFKLLVETYKPILISEHLAWSMEGGYYLNDLLPVPLTRESLQIVSDNVKNMQDYIGRQILVENPSAYMALTASTIPEPEFLTCLAEETGCGLLLDVNNVFVSGSNMGWDIEAYIKSISADLVGEIHLAGHTVKNIDGTELRIDDHGSEVCEEVWQLYANLLEQIGPKPTLVEWDTAIPAFDILCAEAAKAQKVLQLNMKTMGAQCA